MYILSGEKREALLKMLNTAPDEILIDAVRQYKDWQVNIQDSFKEVQGFAGLKAVDLTKPPFASAGATSPTKSDPDPVAPSAPAEAPTWDKKPPGVACSRIGGETKDKIIAKCMKPSTVDDVNKFIGRGPGKRDDTLSLLKLLWERGELVYNGSAYRKK